MLTASYVGRPHHPDLRGRRLRSRRPGRCRSRVAYTGLCGTDLHILHGDMDARVQTPLRLRPRDERHDRRRRRGRRRAGASATASPSCRSPGTAPARPASRATSTSARTSTSSASTPPARCRSCWNVPAETLVRLPDGARASTTRRSSSRSPSPCTTCGARELDARREGRRHRRRPDRRAHRHGRPRTSAPRWSSIELDEKRRAQIDGLGFATLDPRAVDQVAWVDEWTGGAGADVVFEVSGAAAAVLGATALAKVRGTIVVVAIHPTPREIDLQRVFWRELACSARASTSAQDFETAVELVADGVIPADLLITRIVPLEPDRSDAFADLEAGRAMKILVDVGRAQADERPVRPRPARPPSSPAPAAASASPWPRRSPRPAPTSSA